MNNERKLTKIMYVDDDPDLRNIGRISLEKIGGYTVLTCESGEQALQFVGIFQPDLIILDVVMEDMDGPETLAAIRKLPEAVHIPAAFMTSKVSPEEMAQYRELGALGVIQKPFHPRKLPDQVRELWATV